MTWNDLERRNGPYFALFHRIRRRKTVITIEMWANAERDMVALPNIGGALCSTPQSLADTTTRCRAVTLRRRETMQLEFAGVPQTGQPISAASRPKFTIL